VIKIFRDPADRLINGAAILVVTIAALVIAGWLFDVAALRTLLPVWDPMAPLSAVMLILLSAAIAWTRPRRAWANAALLICAVLAIAVFFEQLFGWNLWVQDATSLFDRRPGAPILELPDLDTATATMILIAALLFWRTPVARLHAVGDVFVVFIVVICLEVLLAHSYNSAIAAEGSGFRQIAAHTTLSMMILAFAATPLRPTPGLYAAMRGSAQSAVQLRRLLPATIVFCAIIGLLHVMALHARLDTDPDLAAWTVAAAVTGLAVLLFITSADMRKVEASMARRQIELLAAKSQAEAASEAKGRFMAVMGHELRTPLTAIIGYANLLDEGLAGPQSQEGKNYVDRIRASGWHLVGLIDAVLLYTSGKTPAEGVEQQRVEVAELVRTTAQMFEEEAQRKSLALHVAAGEPAWVISDLRKLRQIIINLLDNALKFTEQGQVDVRVHAREQTVVIDIIDTGIGIGPAHMEHIFEAFQQVDATHTRTRGGMGLGLALTRQLADQIGAQLTAKSSLEGSTFTITLPRAEQHASRAVGLNGARVLVVDDEAGVRRIMVRTLTRYGGEVTQAESAQEAIGIINQNGGFDVLVTDISMPGMTGIQMAQHLKAGSFTSPILFVTGAELDREDQAAIAELGGRLLRKPFDMVELVKEVQQMAESRS
jgi:signal transduction histidine kinase